LNYLRESGRDQYHIVTTAVNHFIQKETFSKILESVASVFVSTLVHTDSFSTHVCIYVQKNVTRVDSRAIKHLHHLLKQGHHQLGVVSDSHEIL